MPRTRFPQMRATRGRVSRGASATRASIVVAALLVIALMPKSVAAEPRRPGVAELLQAITLIRGDRCDQAVPLLRRSNELGNFKNALWNLAECYVQLDRPREAIEVYGQYIRHPRTNERERRDAREAIEALRSRLARVMVTANVEGARVIVNGRSEGETPASLELGPGEHTLSVTSPGFSTWSEDLTTGSGQELAFEAVLRPLPGIVSALSTPSSEIWIDGQRVGETPWEGAIEGGGHIIEARREGYRRLQRQVAVIPGQRSEVELNLEPLSGVLALGVDAPEASLVIDGGAQGVGPFAPLELSPGRYSLELEAPGYAAWSSEVDVLDSRTTRVDVTLPSRQGLRPGWFWSTTALTIASLAAGTALVLVGREQLNDFDSDVSFITGAQASLLQISERRAAGEASFESAQRFDVAGWTLVGLGGALLVTSVVVGLLTRFVDELARAEIILEEGEAVTETSNEGEEQ
jgi:hypothetical protein